MEYILSWWTLAGSLVVAGGLAWVFWPAIVAFLSTPLGRKVAAGAAIAFSLWVAFTKAYSAGRKKELQAIKDNSERVEQERDRKAKELENLTPDQLRRRSAPWLRD